MDHYYPGIRYRENQVFTIQNSKDCPTKMDYKPKSEKRNRKWMEQT